MTADAGKRTAADRAPAGGAASGKGATKTRADRQKTKREAAAKKPPLSPDLAIVQTHVFRGPNYWSYEPCIRLLVDLGSLEFWPSNTVPGFNKKLLKALPGVGEHSCSLGKKGGFKERLEDGTWMGHVAEHVALELQRETGAHISRGKTRSAGPPGQYNVIYGYAEETVGLAAGALAVRLLNHLIKAEDGFDFEAEREALILLAERRQFGPSTQAIIDEAVTRDIPWIRLNEHSLVQLGQGTYQQRIRATMTSKTFRTSTRCRVVTVAVDSFKFLRPVKVGDVVCCYGRVQRIGTTSIAIELEVWIKSVLSTTEEEWPRFKVTEAIFTYVAIDEDGKKHAIQPMAR